MNNLNPHDDLDEGEPWTTDDDRHVYTGDLDNLDDDDLAYTEPTDKNLDENRSTTSPDERTGANNAPRGDGGAPERLTRDRVPVAVSTMPGGVPDGR